MSNSTERGVRDLPHDQLEPTNDNRRPVAALRAQAAVQRIQKLMGEQTEMPDAARQGVSYS